MHKPRICMVALLLTMSAGTGTAAGEEVDISGVAATCFSCHGIDGASVGPSMPSIAGQNENYLRHVMLEQKHDKRYDLKAHAARGVQVVYDDVVAIDPVKRSVATAGGRQFAYDRLILAPGIELDYAAVEGATAGIETAMPHVWKAGAHRLAHRGARVRAPHGGGVCLWLAEKHRGRSFPMM